MMTGPAAIWWIRRDLRLDDNLALHQAIEYADRIVPLFILDDRLLHSRYTGEKRTSFLFSGLRELDRELRSRGSSLSVRHGDPVEALSRVMSEVAADVIFAEEDYSPFARGRDAAVAKVMPLRYAGSPTVRHPTEVMKADGGPYSVFTPYAKRWWEADDEVRVLDSPETVRSISVKSDSLPTAADSLARSAFDPGHGAAIEALRHFVEGGDAPIYRYARDRDRLDLDATSRLSPYLRFGMLSAREAVVSAETARNGASNQSARDSANSWLNEIIWRDFFSAILYHYPHTRTLEFRDRYRSIPWINDPDDLEAWTGARTGYPIVDACLRQLHSEGWMHNRGRMITASFLVKHLLVDWRLGEEHFMQHLVDGDPASNNGNWQWVAGTGADAAPFFRIFNPVTQSKRHDPEGAFIRRWVPELRSVEGKYIHEPWLMPGHEQKRSNCRIGSDYPAPIVDHKHARERALAAYRRDHSI